MTSRHKQSFTNLGLAQQAGSCATIHSFRNSQRSVVAYRVDGSTPAPPQNTCAPSAGSSPVATSICAVLPFRSSKPCAPISTLGAGVLLHHRKATDMAKALVACETSGIMRRALLALGQDVWSCGVEWGDEAVRRRLTHSPPQKKRHAPSRNRRQRWKPHSF